MIVIKFGCERIILLLGLLYDKQILNRLETYIMAGRSFHGFSFYVNLPVQVVATPQVRNVVNNFDYHGDLVSLKRIHGESNVDYRNRLFDVSVHPGGPLYEGVVNSIARDLGFLRTPSLLISLSDNSAGDPVAPNPRVNILANKVVLYSDWRPDGTAVIDREIRTYQLDDTGYYLDDLAAAINQSSYFTASLIGTIRSNTLSSTMVRDTSNLVIHQEYVRSDKLLILDNTNIIQNSLLFFEKKIFETEVLITPASDGEYVVDYVNGEVESYLYPSGQSYCSYYTAQFPMTIDTVPVQVFTFQDSDFQYELFHHETLDSGEVNALPNAEGSEIYHQLFMLSKVFWGE